jgi:hypothetical protein
VQPFAAAHRLTEITRYTEDGRTMLALQAGQFTLTPVPAARQVLVIREGEVTPGQVSRYLAQHGVPTWVPAGADGLDDRQAEAIRLTTLAASLGVSDLDLDEHVHDLASRPASDINNGGLADQIAYIVRTAGPAEAERIIRAAAPATGHKENPDPPREDA